jgi:hypothetical protein
MEILFRSVLPIYSVLKLKQLQCLFLILCHHPRCSSTKQHTVISTENYQKLPSSILSIKNRCTKHGNRYELYCAIHDIACCGMCIRDGHRHCEELLPIHEVNTKVAILYRWNVNFSENKTEYEIYII